MPGGGGATGQAPPTLSCASWRITLDIPRVMGVLNLTPDSFSDGGQFADCTAAVTHAEALIDAGADLLDVGAESTRPGARPLPKDEELARLLPVLRALRDCPIPVSVDTYKPEVMRAALDEGAAMINDIYALRQPRALDVVAQSDCAICVMHMQGDPHTMQHETRYDDVVADVREFLAQRIRVLQGAGIAAERIVVDPGFGFGKTREQNYRMLREFGAFTTLGVAALAGLSRKGMLGRATGRPVTERVAASVAAALAAVARGARLVRVHDVAATIDALKVWEMVENPQLEEPRLRASPHKSK
jgi:dihydropteroate synthase